MSILPVYIWKGAKKSKRPETKQRNKWETLVCMVWKAREREEIPCILIYIYIYINIGTGVPHKGAKPLFKTLSLCLFVCTLKRQSWLRPISLRTLRERSGRVAMGPKAPSTLPPHSLRVLRSWDCNPLPSFPSFSLNFYWYPGKVRIRFFRCLHHPVLFPIIFHPKKVKNSVKKLLSSLGFEPWTLGWEVNQLNH